MNISVLHLYKDYRKDAGFPLLLERLGSFVRNLVAETAAEMPTGETISLTHAHSWYQDGPDALRLRQEHGIPYVLTLTPEDLRHLEAFSLKSKRYDVLENAEKVVFPNQHFQYALADKLSDKLADAVFSRSSVIYDGISPFWFQNLRRSKPVSLIHIRLLTALNVGGDSAVETVEKAVKQIRKQNLSVDVTTFDPNAIGEAERMEMYRRHDMLVQPTPVNGATTLYAEALSQGLPVLYARQGCFDGIFPEGTAGFSVMPHNAHDLAEKILLVSERYATVEQHIADLHPLHPFNWDEIYRQYLRVYDVRKS
jgi:glycosyltransferase involved in cell wall biosynthesis